MNANKLLLTIYTDKGREMNFIYRDLYRNIIEHRYFAFTNTLMKEQILPFLRKNESVLEIITHPISTQEFKELKKYVPLLASLCVKY